MPSFFFFFSFFTIIIWKPKAEVLQLVGSNRGVFIVVGFACFFFFASRYKLWAADFKGPYWEKFNAVFLKTVWTNDKEVFYWRFAFFQCFQGTQRVSTMSVRWEKYILYCSCRLHCTDVKESTTLRDHTPATRLASSLFKHVRTQTQAFEKLRPSPFLQAGWKQRAKSTDFWKSVGGFPFNKNERCEAVSVSPGFEKQPCGWNLGFSQVCVSAAGSKQRAKHADFCRQTRVFG